MPFAGELFFSQTRVGLWSITESEAALRAGITLSPASMALVNSSGSAKRRRELLAVRALLHRMGISDNDLYYQDEKPMLHSGRHISISHSGTMACVALCADQPTGVDIQQIKPRLSIVVRWLTKNAPDAAHPDISLIRSGLLWTAREAMFKLDGRPGVSLRDFHTDGLDEADPGDRGCFAGYRGEAEKKDKGRYRIHYRVLNEYVLAVAHHDSATPSDEAGAV